LDCKVDFFEWNNVTGPRRSAGNYQVRWRDEESVPPVDGDLQPG